MGRWSSLITKRELEPENRTTETELARPEQTSQHGAVSTRGPSLILIQIQVIGPKCQDLAPSQRKLNGSSVWLSLQKQLRIMAPLAGHVGCFMLMAAKRANELVSRLGASSTCDLIRRLEMHPCVYLSSFARIAASAGCLRFTPVERAVAPSDLPSTNNICSESSEQNFQCQLVELSSSVLFFSFPLASENR